MPDRILSDSDLLHIRNGAELESRISALQMVIEQILAKLDGENFKVSEFRQTLEEMRKMCYEQDLFRLEKIHPGLAAKIDAHRPLIGLPTNE